MKTLYIIHDNGIKGYKGCTDYSISEVHAKGGVNAILNNYRKSGAVVYEWYIR